MDFKAIGTVVLLLLSLSVMALIYSKFSGAGRSRSLDSIIESASNGRRDSMRFVPEVDMDLCEQVMGESGCNSPLGVEPGCNLYKGEVYHIEAVPTESGVCLNVTEVGS